VEVRTAHTDELPQPTLEAIRALLVDVFAGEFTEHDWEHTLGGVHALTFVDDEVVGHGSLVERRLTYDERSLRTGYVEGFAVRRGHRARGHGSAIMDALEEIIRAEYRLGALASTDEAAHFYERRGWIRWSGPTEPDGEGAVYVLPAAARLNPELPLVADERAGDAW
jgi:aminoglycoside 2'-N-acetyltransferase I